MIGDPSSHINSTAATDPATDPPAKPVALPVLFDNIPAELREGRRFVLWRYELRDGKWTKPPYQPNGRHADSTDSETWSTLAEVAEAYRRGGWDGIGRIHLPEDNITGADGDHCRNPATGAITGKAAAAVLRLDSYTELSPSGTGLRAFCHGRKPGRRSRVGGFELYDGLTEKGEPGGRYLTLTGNHLAGTPTTVNDRQAEVAAVYQRMFGENSPFTGTAQPGAGELSDEDLLAHARAAKNGAAFQALYDRGEQSRYKSASEADLALCDHLAFWTRRDAARIDRLFRRSALMRPKWLRDDYRERTLTKAIEGCTSCFGDECGNGRPTHREGDGGSATTGCQIILAYFRDRYRPTFRRGNSIHAADGRDVPMNEATAVPDSGLITKLESASNAPHFKGGGLNRNALPAFFRNWSKVAWGDLLQELTEEDEAELKAVGDVKEEFRRLIREAMLTEVTLAQTVKAGPTVVESRIEHRSLIGWCQCFAKVGPWRQIRSKLCWCKLVLLRGEEVVLKVAIRPELFAQIRADKRLVGMSEGTFKRRAERYGVGTALEEDRPHGRRAVVLDDELVADLTSTLPEDNASADETTSDPPQTERK
jgi:hypothetical protein